MSKFNIKSILLGIGIGVVFTSVVSMIYLAGMEPSKELTEKEVLELAAKYDLVKRSSLLTGSGTTESEPTESIATEPTSDQSKNPEETEPAASPAPSASEALGTTAGTAAAEVIFEVESGTTSEKIAVRLHKAGLIEDEAAFVKLLDDLGLESRIQVGSFKINKGDGMKEIAEKITR
jgi:hypothetical protein